MAKNGWGVNPIGKSSQLWGHPINFCFDIGIYILSWPSSSGPKCWGRLARGSEAEEAPPLFVIGPEGDGQLVNYRVRQNYYIVDRLFAAAELRMGGEHQQWVRISRTDGRARWAKRLLDP
jgi:hypothetical protein